MKIYIASKSQEVGRVWREILASKGHVVTSRWLDGVGYGIRNPNPDEKRLIAIVDSEDVESCEILVLRSEPDGSYVPGGKHVETGLALAAHKPVFVVGNPENVFHYHPLVTLCETFDVFLEKLPNQPIVCIPETQGKYCGAAILPASAMTPEQRGEI